MYIIIIYFKNPLPDVHVPCNGKFSWGANFFADFVDRLVSVKMKTMGVVTSCKKVNHTLELRLIEGTKVKIYFEGLQGDSAKISRYIVSLFYHYSDL